MENIEWIFFDIGNTLVNEDLAQRKRIDDLISIQREMGNDLSFDDVYDKMASASKSYSASPFYQALSDMGIEMNIEYPKELEAPYEDALEVLMKLKSNYMLGVIGNQSAGTLERLKKNGIFNLIDLCISSAEEELWKPDIRIYQLALDRAKCDAEKSVMIGDRLDNDIYPAKKLGMKTIWIRQGLGGVQEPRSKEFEADYVVSTLEELLPLFGI